MDDLGSSASRRGSRILIVEDEGIIALDLRHRLGRLGYEVAGVARTGAAAVEMASTLQPKAVLMDIRLEGDMDGVEAASVIRGTLGIPVVFLTGQYDRATVERARVVDASGYLLKPIDDRELEVVLEVTLFRADSEANLRRHKGWLEAILEGIGEGVVATDEEGRITYLSDVAAVLLGRERADCLGRLRDELLSMEPSLEPEVGKTASFGCARLRCGDVLLSVEGAVTRQAGGSILVFRDVSERLAAEERSRLQGEQLAHMQKMDALGRLVGGVAHDFANLLTAITGYTDLILSRAQLDAGLRDEVEEIRLAGDRAVSLTRQLLAFSRRQPLSPRVVDLNEVVAGIEKLLRRLVGEERDLMLLRASEPVLVLVDPNKLEQVLMNLVVNARDATSPGGRITVEVGHRTLIEVGTRPEVRPGDYGVLTVMDDGTGMDAETLQHLFEPYFTTKDEGRGTGLGLATVYGIVKQSDGDIEVESEPGRGSSFRVLLPMAEGERAKRDVQPQAESLLSGEGEAVLIVEDDPVARTLMRWSLHRSGYRVLEAAHPGEALLIAEQHRERLDLLITDVVMPRLCGPELARRIGELHPEAAVLLTSAYPAEELTRFGVDAESAQFLAKPFSPGVLARRVRDVLAGSRVR